MDDATFLRYLRARQYDATKAAAMLRDTLKWRAEFGVRAMESWRDVIRAENASGKLYVRGFDREGGACLYMKPQYENTKDHDGNLKHLVYNMERCVAVMAAQGAGKEKISLLIDYENYSLSNAPPMKTAMETLSILQNHYPERLRCAYCIRPPTVFTFFWSAISPFIDPVTKAKIAMVKNDSLRATLAERVDPAILEACCGGDDTRPFVSQVYLDGPFHLEFGALL